MVTWGGDQGWDFRGQTGGGTSYIQGGAGGGGHRGVGSPWRQGLCPGGAETGSGVRWSGSPTPRLTGIPFPRGRTHRVAQVELVAEVVEAHVGPGPRWRPGDGAVRGVAAAGDVEGRRQALWGRGQRSGGGASPQAGSSAPHPAVRANSGPKQEVPPTHQLSVKA